MTSTTTRDRFGRYEVRSEDGTLLGRVLPKNAGAWAAAKVGGAVGYHLTFREAVEAVSA